MSTPWQTLKGSKGRFTADSGKRVVSYAAPSAQTWSEAEARPGLPNQNGFCATLPQERRCGLGANQNDEPYLDCQPERRTIPGLRRRTSADVAMDEGSKRQVNAALQHCVLPSLSHRQVGLEAWPRAWEKSSSVNLRPVGVVMGYVRRP